ncbi:hypothetical protein BJX99DRAFT_133035 [Aspergillus californicus]
MTYFRPDFSIRRWTSAIWAETEGEEVPIWDVISCYLADAHGRVKNRDSGERETRQTLKGGNREVGRNGACDIQESDRSQQHNEGGLEWTFWRGALVLLLSLFVLDEIVKLSGETEAKNAPLYGGVNTEQHGVVVQLWRFQGRKLPHTPVTLRSNRRCMRLPSGRGQSTLLLQLSYSIYVL